MLYIACKKQFSSIQLRPSLVALAPLCLMAVIAMMLSLFFSMCTYALVTSITPGPVNVVAISYGTHYGLKVGLIFVAGAAVGYTLLLLLIGLGLHQVLESFPLLTQIIQWLGIGFLLYLAYGFFVHSAEIQSNAKQTNYPFLYGVLMQWLNPKAWLCAVLGIGAYTLRGNVWLVWQFGLIYLVICFLSIACWAYVGVFLQHFLQKPNYLKYFNQTMAFLLIVSAVFLVI